MLLHSLAVATAPLKLPLRQAIETVASLGVQGIQFDAREELPANDFGQTARRQLLHALAERNLKLASLTFPLRGPIGAEERLEARIAALRQAMTFTRELKGKLLTVPVGRLPDEDEEKEAKLLDEILRDLARHGNYVGVTLCLMTRGEEVSRLKGLLASITEGPLGIDLDPAGCVLSKTAPVDVVRELHPFLEHVQVRDAIRQTSGFGKEVPVGRGEVDWDELAAVLNEAEYRGWLTVTRSEGDDRLGDVTRAVAFIKNLLPR